MYIVTFIPLYIYIYILPNERSYSATTRDIRTKQGIYMQGIYVVMDLSLSYRVLIMTSWTLHLFVYVSLIRQIHLLCFSLLYRVIACMYLDLHRLCVYRIVILLYIVIFASCVYGEYRYLIACISWLVVHSSLVCILSYMYRVCIVI